MYGIKTNDHIHIKKNKEKEIMFIGYILLNKTVPYF